MDNIDYSGESATTAKEIVTEAVTEATKSAEGGDMVKILIIVITVMVALILIMSIITVIKACGTKKKVDAISMKIGNMEFGKSSDIGVVFCKKCGSNYAMSEKKCPYCGEKR